MKILKIELQNINSLKCEQPIVVDFESERFIDAGLFAITGSTGAGKTTLLDAITIALYRRVARFEKSNSNAKLEDVVSYGAATAMSRVTFESKNERFEAQWDIRLLSNNAKTLAKPVENVRLKNLTTKRIIAETKKTCDEKIIELTQLNYDQFLRSVLLAQGEFAAFLTAKNADKALLLQQIAGDDIYRKIGETLKRRIYDEKRILELIKNKINTDDLLSNELLVELQSEVLRIDGDIKDIDIQLGEIESDLKWYVDKQKYESQLNEVKTENELLESDFVKYAEQLRLLELHEIAEPFRASVVELNRLEAEIANILLRSEELIKLSTINKTELTKVDADLKLAHKNTVDQENSALKWQPILDKVIALDTNISNKTKEILQKKQLQTTLVNVMKGLNDEALLIKTKRDLADKNLQNLQLYLNQNENLPLIESQLGDWKVLLSERKNASSQIKHLNEQFALNIKAFEANKTAIELHGKYIERDETDLKVIDAELIDLQNSLKLNEVDVLMQQSKKLHENKSLNLKLNQLSQAYKETIANQSVLKVAWLALQQELLKYKADLNVVNGQIASANLQLTDAEALFEKDQYIQSLEAERLKLKQGEPCALCGSVDHPLVQKYAAVELKDSKLKVAQRKLILQEFVDKKSLLDVAMARTDSTIKSQGVQLERMGVEIQELKSKFSTSETNLKIDDIIDFDAIILNTENEIAVLESKIAENQKAFITKNKKEEERKLLTDKLNKGQLQLSRYNTENEGIDKSNAKLQSDLNKFEEQLKNVERELSIQLSKVELELPEPLYSELFVDQLNSNIKVYKANVIKQQENTTSIQHCDLEYKNISEQIKLKGTDLTAVEDGLIQLNKELADITEERNVLLPTNINADAKRKEIQIAVQKRKKEELEIKNTFDALLQQKNVLHSETLLNEKSRIANVDAVIEIQKNLALQLLSSNFNTLDEVKQALLTDDNKNAYSKLRADLNNRKVAIVTLRMQIEKELALISLTEKLDMDRDTLLDDKMAKAAEKDLLLKRNGEISESFRKDKEIKDRNVEVVRNIKLQELELRKWNNLNVLLGGSQEALNTYVQRLTLQNLIHLANLHLFNLNKRYSLLLNKSYKEGEELNFKLVDHYQADETRLVETSSGGEKFLISLALALGLSDLASHNVSIKSLFIDEGFGTLDTNTLETVISTLETLKSQGKTIGIISHVDSLKERIPVQIQVLKKSNGVSIVEIN